MILFRHTDTRRGFTCQSDGQPAARWHAAGEGPVQYLSTTPDGAWAEFLRHEEITDPADLEGVTRRVWAIEVPDEVVRDAIAPPLSKRVARGDLSTWARCQSEAAALRADGATALRVPSAALDDAGGHRSTGSGIADGAPRPAENVVVFGSGRDWTGWMCHDTGGPDRALLPQVRPLRGRAG